VAVHSLWPYACRIGPIRRYQDFRRYEERRRAAIAERPISKARRLVLSLAFGLAGIGLIAFGAIAMYYDAQHGDLFNLLWATVLIVIGPLLIYVSAIGFSLVFRNADQSEDFVSNDELLDQIRHGSGRPESASTESD
jgi:hypothetical protein